MLSTDQLRVHNKALKLCAQLKSTEAELVETLIEVKALQIHQAFGLSMFRYAVEELHLTESQAYAFGAVAKHALEFGELRTAPAGFGSRSACTACRHYEPLTKTLFKQGY